jgi:hypothetical protein
MLARRADVIDDQVVVGDLVPLLGMIPEVAYILDEFAVVIDQHVVDGDHPPWAEAGFAALLQPLDALPIEGLFLPDGFRQPAIQTGLIRRGGEFPVDRRDVLLGGDHQSREVFGEMMPFRLIGERRTKHVQGLFDDGGIVYNSRHGANFFPIFFAPAIGISYRISYPDYHFSRPKVRFAKRQF